MFVSSISDPFATPFYFSPDEPSGGPAPAADPAETPAPVETPKADTPKAQDNAENAAQRLLRKAEARVAELEAAERTRKQADMSELDRLKAELDEIKPVRDEYGRFKATLQEQFDRELSAIPEDKREQVLDLVGSGGLDSQLRALQAAKALIGGAAAPVPAIKAGSVTQPGSNQAPSASEKIAGAMKGGNPLEAIRLMRGEQFKDR